MSVDAVAALAAAGGMAVVQAAGTDAWATVRQTVARLLGRGDGGREAAELERLDQMRAALAADGQAAQQARWEAVWQTRLELLLEGLEPQGRAVVVAQLAALVAQAQADGGRGGVQAGAGGVAAGGDVRIGAEGGSVAGAVVRMEGGVSLGGPFPSAGRQGS